MLHYENQLWQNGYTYVAGVDEVGRGPLAGPVVAAACILPKNVLFDGVKDSKALSEKKRKAIYSILISHPEIFWAVSFVDEARVDVLNIRQATLLAMKQALGKLPCIPEYILVDGRDLPETQFPGQAIVSGDALSQSIAAASILAKCSRDAYMDLCHATWPQYNFITNKGYGTKVHIEALVQYGPCPIHRKTFIKNFISNSQVS